MRKQLSFILVVVVFAALFGFCTKFYRTYQLHKLERCKARLIQWAKCVGYYRMMYKKYPDRLMDSAPSPKHFDRGCDGEPIGYELSSSGEEWTLSCRGIHHASLGLLPDCPKYTEQLGLIEYKPR